MATSIIDLDDVLGQPKKVRLGGNVYTLPADLPVELYLRINRFAQTDATEVEMVQELYNDVLNLFRYRQPDLESLPLTLSQLVVAISRIYGGEQPESEAVPPQAASGTASTKRTRKTKSGS